ncbi:MAG: hypothetical protein HQL41_13225 [Alphaproteobacteria bacterium]|nr:hypothetical protein [Alphaproteobacteria bacterium]
MATPRAIYQGTKRLRFFDGEADWASGDKILVVVCNAEHDRAWDAADRKFVNVSPPIDAAFVAYLYPNEPEEIRERWRNRLKLASLPGAKVCGYEWVCSSDGLPHGAATRFSRRIM